MESKVDKAKESRPESEERTESLARYSHLVSLKESLESELEGLKDLDPSTLELKKNEIKKVKDSVNQWTDNIYILQSFCCNKFNMTSSQFCQQFAIPTDLDSI